MSDLPVAIVTGAGRGIGRATVSALSTKGYAVVCVARTAAKVERAAAEIPVGLPVVADLEDPSAPARIVEVAFQWRSRVDALINNAGIAPLLPIEQTTPEVWNRVLAVNLTAVYALCRACWPVFTRARSGVIVNVSSIAARDPFPGFSAYGATKAAVNLLGLALAREGAAVPIRVHTIAPGAVETDMFRAMIDEQTWGKDKTLAPEEVANVITSAVTGELRYTSGEVVYLRRNPA